MLGPTEPRSCQDMRLRPEHEAWRMEGTGIIPPANVTHTVPGLACACSAFRI